MDNRITVDRSALFSPLPLIAVKAELSGFSDMRAVANAIRAALSANRIFCSRVVLDESGAAWIEPAQKVTCKVAVVNKTFEQIVSEQAGQAFDIENGEFIRFFLKPWNNGAQLVIAAHKLVCDVRSLVILIEDIIAALSGKNLERREARLADDDDIPEKAGLVVKTAVGQINKQWLKNKGGNKRSFGAEDYERIFSRCHKGKTSSLLRGELPEQMVEKADKTAELYGTERIGVIMMALVNAIGEMANISYYIDTRSEDDRTIRNLTFPVSIVHGYDDRRDVCANIQYMQEILDATEYEMSKLSIIPSATAMLEPTLVDSVFMTALDGYADPISVKLTRNFGYDGDTRNVSVRVIDARGHEREKISVYPPCELNIHTSLAVVVDESRVEMAVSCPDEKAEARARKLFENFTKAIMKLTKEAE